MKARTQAAVIGSLLVLWMLSGIVTSGEIPENKETFVGPTLASVRVRTSVAQNYSPPVRIRAETVANRHVMVPARIAAVVADLPIAEGSIVQAGDVLCQLEEEDRRTVLAEAEGRLRVAQVNLKGVRQLQSQSLSSARAMAEAEASLENANSTVERARLQLKHTKIAAPFAGLVDELSTEKGALLTNGQPCAVLLELDPIRVRGDIAESEVDKVLPGAHAEVQLISGQTAEGNLTYVARSANQQSRTFRVEVEVPNPGLRLREGLTADLIIDGKPVLAHRIPASSLILNPEDGLVVKVLDENDIVRQFPVEILHDNAEGLWVSGIPTRTRLITVGHYYVKAGQEMRGEEEPAEQADEATPDAESTPKTGLYER